MFLLYQKKHRVFPEETAIGGSIYHINADFRNILRIYDMLEDENILPGKKINILTQWFFEVETDSKTIPPGGAADAFIDFIKASNPVEPEEDEEDEENEENGESAGKIEPQFCYESDGKEIYAGFLSEYGIDLIDVDFLHWYKFRVLLENLSPESAFKKKIELRFMDLSGFRDNPRRFDELARAQRAVRLPVKSGAVEFTEITGIKEFEEIWGKAGNN